MAAPGPWDVVGTAPAQVQNPWAVKSVAPAPVEPSKQPESKGDAVDSLLGVPELAWSTLLNVPHNVAAGIQDIYNKVSGKNESTLPDIVPSGPSPGKAGQQLVQNVKNVAGPIVAPVVSAVRNALPGEGTVAGDLLHNAGQVAGDVGNILAPAVLGGSLVGGLRNAGDALAGAAPSAAETNFGLRTAQNAPIARNVAGNSGREALTLHNQPIANTVAGAVAGIEPGTPVTPEALTQARVGPNSVYDRAGAMVPTGPLSPAATAQVHAAGTSDLVTHSPDAQAIIDAQKQRLLGTPDQPAVHTGAEVVDNLKALRKEGYQRIGSDDVEQNNLGSAQLDLAGALEQHIQDSIPPNATVSMGQLAQARQALAQNHTVQGVLRGGNVDMQALAKIARNNPNLLTGPLADLADFGENHGDVASLPSKSVLYNPPSVAKDIGSVDLLHPVRSLAQLFGGVAARRSLTGAPGPTNIPHVTGLGGEFEPLHPGSLDLRPPPGQVITPNQGQLPLGDEFQ